MMESAYIATPIGILEISGDSNGIGSIRFCDDPIATSEMIPEVLLDAVTQIKEYFSNKRKIFELPLNPDGTSFQKTVWQKLLEIPYGKTASYQQLANTLGDPKVIRAAASANGKNPISIVIPCHRVVGTDGSLTGYAGGLHRKKWLLEHESGIIQGELF